MFTALAFAALFPAAHADGLSDCNDSCGTDFDTCIEQSNELSSRACDPLEWSSTERSEGLMVVESCKQQLTPHYYTACAEGLGVCYETCGEAYSGGSEGAGMVLEDCPEGSTASPLGTCLPNFGQAPEDVDPDDRCPAGYAPGPDDRCVPTIELVPADVVGGLDDTGFLVCPDGMVPGPIGGCVVDTFDPEHTPEQCPPGFVGGPDGQCVPNRGGDLGQMVLGRAVRGMQALGVDMTVTGDLLDAWGVVEVDDMRRAIEQVEAEWR